MRKTIKPKSSAQLKDDLIMQLVLIVRKIAPPDEQRWIDRKMDALAEAAQREEYERYDI
jgi:hypothetical protein